MNKSIWAAAALVLVAGLVACSGSSNSVVGSWVPDVEKTADSVYDMTSKFVEKLPAEQRAQAQAVLPTRETVKAGMAKEMAGGVLEVKGDGTFSMSGKKEDATTGTWAEKDGVTTFTPKMHNGQPAEGEKAKPMTVGWEGSDLVLKMEAPKGAEAAGITEVKIYFKKK